MAETRNRISSATLQESLLKAVTSHDDVKAALAEVRRCLTLARENKRSDKLRKPLRGSLNALQLACSATQSGNEDIVKELVLAGFSFLKVSSGAQSFFWAAKQHIKQPKELHPLFFDVTQEAEEKKIPPKKTEEVEAEEAPELEFEPGCPLDLALRGNRYKPVEFFLGQLSTEVTLPETLLATILHIYRNKQFRMSALVLNHFRKQSIEVMVTQEIPIAEINKSDDLNEGLNLLDWALQDRYYHLVAYLFMRGADPSPRMVETFFKARDDQGNTILMLMLARSDLEDSLTNTLYELHTQLPAGANKFSDYLKCTNSDGWNALMLAVKNHPDQIPRLTNALSEYDAAEDLLYEGISSETFVELFAPVLEKDINLALQLLESWYDEDESELFQNCFALLQREDHLYQDSAGNGVAHLAVTHNCLYLAELAECGFDLTEQNRQGFTPLRLLAGLPKHAKCIKELLSVLVRANQKPDQPIETAAFFVSLLRNEIIPLQASHIIAVFIEGGINPDEVGLREIFKQVIPVTESKVPDKENLSNFLHSFRDHEGLSVLDWLIFYAYAETIEILVTSFGLDLQQYIPAKNLLLNPGEPYSDTINILLKHARVENLQPLLNSVLSMSPRKCTMDVAGLILQHGAHMDSRAINLEYFPELLYDTRLHQSGHVVYFLEVLPQTKDMVLRCPLDQVTLLHVAARTGLAAFNLLLTFIVKNFKPHQAIQMLCHPGGDLGHPVLCLSEAADQECIALLARCGYVGHIETPDLGEEEPYYSILERALNLKRWDFSWALIRARANLNPNPHLPLLHYVLPSYVHTAEQSSLTSICQCLLVNAPLDDSDNSLIEDSSVDDRILLLNNGVRLCKRILSDFFTEPCFDKKTRRAFCQNTVTIIIIKNAFEAFRQLLEELSFHYSHLEVQNFLSQKFQIETTGSTPGTKVLTENASVLHNCLIDRAFPFIQLLIDRGLLQGNAEFLAACQKELTYPTSKQNAASQEELRRVIVRLTPQPVGSPALTNGSVAPFPQHRYALTNPVEEKGGRKRSASISALFPVAIRSAAVPKTTPVIKPSSQHTSALEQPARPPPGLFSPVTQTSRPSTPERPAAPDREPVRKGSSVSPAHSQ